MEEIIMSLGALAGLGCVAGLLAGLLGIGGGTILVPALVIYGHYFYPGKMSDDIIMHMALGTSLAIIIPTGMSSAWAQIKRKAVDWDVLKRLTPGLLLGVILGVVTAAHLDGDILQIIFAVGMYAMTVLIAKKPKPEHTYPKLMEWHVEKNVPLPAANFSQLLGVAQQAFAVAQSALAVVDAVEHGVEMLGQLRGFVDA